MKRLLDFRLVRLVLRRSISPAWLAFVLGVVQLVLWTSPEARAEAWTGVDPAGATRWLARESAWIAGLLLVLPALVTRAARFASQDWVRERDFWIARAPSRSTIVGSTWLGLCLAALAQLGLVALLIEAQTANGQSLAHAGRIRGLSQVALEEGVPQSWQLDDPGPRAPSGTLLSVPLSLAGGSPGAEIELIARRLVEGEERARTRVVELIAGRERIEIELPDGPGELQFHLVRRGGGFVALRADRGLELWAPGVNERSSITRIVAQALFLCAAAAALGLALGGSMSPWAVLGMLCAAWIACAGASEVPIFVPGVNLPEALATVGRGRVPEGPSASSTLFTVLSIALGLMGATLGLRRTRGRRT